MGEGAPPPSLLARDGCDCELLTGDWLAFDPFQFQVHQLPTAHSPPTRTNAGRDRRQCCRRRLSLLPGGPLSAKQLSPCPSTHISFAISGVFHGPRNIVARQVHLLLFFEPIEDPRNMTASVYIPICNYLVIAFIILSFHGDGAVSAPVLGAFFAQSGPQPRVLCVGAV